MEEFLRKIGIRYTGEYTDDGNYYIELEDDDQYARVYSSLDKSLEVEEDEDASQLTDDTSSIQYINDNYTITLLADYDSEQYALICREN